MQQDGQYLRTLSILHYVYATLVAVMSLFGLLFAVLGAMFLAIPATPTKGSPPPQLGWFFVFFGVGVTLLGWTIAALTALAGRFLARCAHWLYCLIIACVNCIIAIASLLFLGLGRRSDIPQMVSSCLGAILGVFTIIVLVRPGVKQLFDAPAAVPADLTPIVPWEAVDDPFLPEGEL